MNSFSYMYYETRVIEKILCVWFHSLNAWCIAVFDKPISTDNWRVYMNEYYEDKYNREHLV